MIEDMGEARSGTLMAQKADVLWRGVASSAQSRACAVLLCLDGEHGSPCYVDAQTGEPVCSATSDITGDAVSS